MLYFVIIAEMRPSLIPALFRQHSKTLFKILQFYMVVIAIFILRDTKNKISFVCDRDYDYDQNAWANFNEILYTGSWAQNLS